MYPTTAIKIQIASTLVISLITIPASAGSFSDSNYLVSISGSGTQLTTTEPDATTFSTTSTFNNYNGSVITPVATISGGAVDYNGSTNPGSGFNNDGGISNWLTAYSGTSITIDFNSIESYFGILWGSIDTSNTIKFYNGTSLIASYTGSEIASNGGNYYPAAGSFVGFTANAASSDFNKIVLSDNTTSFESVNYATLTSAVPVPTAFWMFLTGFVGLLGLKRRNQSNHSCTMSVG